MYVDSLYVNHIKRNANLAIGICGNQIKHAGEPTDDTDVATKSYVDTHRNDILPEIRIGNENSYSTIKRFDDFHVDSYVSDTKAQCDIYKKVVQFTTSGKTTIYTFKIPIDVKIAHVRSILVLKEPEGTSMSIVCNFMHNSNFYYLLPTVTTPYSTPILPIRLLSDIANLDDTSPAIDEETNLDDMVVVDDIIKSREITANLEVTHSYGKTLNRYVRNKLILSKTTDNIIAYTLRFSSNQPVMTGNALIETMQFS